MSTLAYDTIVIGAGLAGLTAALTRARSGAKTLLLATGHGTTHWATGCVDLLDCSADNPLAAIAALPAHHPYHHAGQAALEAACAQLQSVCADAGYPFVGSLSHNLHLPTALGALRPTCLIPATMAAGDSRLLSDGATLVVGFAELRDFFPPLIAANLREQGFAAEGRYLSLPPSGRKLDFSTVSFAHLFEQAAFRNAVGVQLREQTRSGGFRRIAMPAVLGLDDPTGVLNELQRIAGLPIFEIPTLPPSVAGMRLYRILERAVEAADGRVQIGSKVQRAEREGTRISAIYSEAAAREQRHRAEHYILATGGIAGGGVRADERGGLTETALDLPLQAPDGRGNWFAARFLNEDGHPVFKAGVAVDRQMRPLDANGALYSRNVAVAGMALAGCDAIREGCLEGLALATGYRAAHVLGQ